MELPDDITHLANRIFEGGYAKRSDMFRQVFVGPVIDGQAHAWDVTNYQAHGKYSREAEDINQTVSIREWQQLPQATNVDFGYAREICLLRARPVLVLKFKVPGTGEITTILADGNHRLARAAMQGMKSFPAHQLTLEQSEVIKLPDHLANNFLEA